MHRPAKFQQRTAELLTMKPIFRRLDIVALDLVFSALNYATFVKDIEQSSGCQIFWIFDSVVSFLNHSDSAKYCLISLKF